jgi:phosphoglycolate phosphatase-like HAD superfamily hydrolase
MEVKHKECFIPNIIGHYGLAAVSKFARECAEFVNLYSSQRGINRFPALVAAFDLLKQRPEVIRRGFEVPPISEIRAWLTRETGPSNPTLAREVERTRSAELRHCLEWSKAVNRTIEEFVRDVPPFPMVRESLQALHDKADLLVCSATPVEALSREWAEHDLDSFLRLIAGQEHGSKKEIIAAAAAPSHYERDHVLMIGDAPGDHKAAVANGVLFYPIVPNREEESWQRFHDEALNRFLGGKYAGKYMDSLVSDFQQSLPNNPPWNS